MRVGSPKLCLIFVFVFFKLDHNRGHIVGADAHPLALLDGPLAELKQQRQQEKKLRRKKEKRKRGLLVRALGRARAEGLHLEFGVASGQSINFIAARVPQHQVVQSVPLPQSAHTSTAHLMSVALPTSAHVPVAAVAG